MVALAALGIGTMIGLVGLWLLAQVLRVVSAAHEPAAHTVNYTPVTLAPTPENERAVARMVRESQRRGLMGA